MLKKEKQKRERERERERDLQKVYGKMCASP